MGFHLIPKDTTSAGLLGDENRVEKHHFNLLERIRTNVLTKNVFPIQLRNQLSRDDFHAFRLRINRLIIRDEMKCHSYLAPGYKNPLNIYEYTLSSCLSFNCNALRQRGPMYSHFKCTCLISTEDWLGVNTDSEWQRGPFESNKVTQCRELYTFAWFNSHKHFNWNC